MARRQALIGVVGLVGLVGLMAGCGGGSTTRLYNADATYRCLKARPEYHSAGRSPLNGFYLFPEAPNRPAPFGLGSHVLGEMAGSGERMTAGFSTPAYAAVEIFIFDTIHGAQATHRLMLSEGLAQETTKFDRNAIISWGGAEQSYPGDPKVRHIVLGCLRTL